MVGINGWVRAWLRRNWVENQAAEAVSLLLTSCTGFLYKVDMFNFVTALSRVSIFPRQNVYETTSTGYTIPPESQN